MKKNMKKFANSYHEGGHLNKKAFTLIELLAVIIVLAIIVVIIVPTVINEVKKSKKNGAIESARGYWNSINHYTLEQQQEDSGFELNGIYNIDELKQQGLTFQGKEPTNGFIVIKENVLKDACLTIGDYQISINNKEANAQLGECSEQNIYKKYILMTNIPIPVARTVDNVKYYEASWTENNPIYYNPVLGEYCDNYHVDNSKTGYNGITNSSSSVTSNNNGCLKWYAYSENNDGTVNLLLDHNTTANIAWVSSIDYGSDISTLTSQFGLTYPIGTIFNGYGSYGNWDKGPITLLNKLKFDTSNWSNKLKRIDSYTNSNNYNNSGMSKERFTIDYREYKARLITFQEVTYIIGISYDERTFSGEVYSYRTLNWLVNNISTNNTKDAPYGYWTASPCADVSSKAWYVSEGNRVLYSYIDGRVNVDNRNGLRPVITVSKY